MRIPLMLPVALLGKASKLAEDNRQTLDAFIAAALTQHVEALSASKSDTVIAAE